MTARMHVNAPTLRRASAPLASLPRRPGRGLLEVERYAGRSVVTRLRAESPLRLLAPRGCPGNAAWVFTSTFGGGLVAGDSIDLSVRVGANATCALATQASTKVYRASLGKAARQVLNADIGPGAACLLLPDPVTCFAGAAFEQRLTFDLAETASLVLVDWLTSGRRARGERWAFAHYLSRIDASVQSKLVFRDSIRLDESDGPIAGKQRMGRCDCFGLVLLLAPQVAAACARILAFTAGQPIARCQDILFCASPLPGGVVIRVAGPQTETVAMWIRQRLDFVPGLLGGDPWARKW